MRNLDFITHKKPESLFIDIVKNKHGDCRKILNAATPATALVSKQSLIFSRYLEYRRHRKKLELIAPLTFTKQEKNCLLGCYSSKTDGVDVLVEEIRGMLDVHRGAHCPYCGLDSIQTFDHYLPKSDFPEFSVFSYNLVPCCHDCNNIKNDNWLIRGKRLFLHYYFDAIPDEVFLYAKVSFAHGAPNVTFTLRPPNRNPIYDIILSHYKELDILNKIEDKCNSYLVIAYRENQMAIKEGVTSEQLRNNRKRSIKVKEASYGKNHWEVVIDRGILNCPDYFI